MSLHLVVNTDHGLILDGAALRALIAAVEFQLTNWREKGSPDLDDDELADLQNDIQYTEILLDRLKTEYGRIDPLRGR